MSADIIISVVAGVLLVVAAIGTIYPVLPGSPVAIVTLLVWGWVVGGTAAWTAAIIGVVLATIGWSASAVLTGRRLKRERVPGGSILVGVIGGIIGMFLIPVFGLFAGFAAGLLLSEYVRRGDWGVALRASGQALKAMGTGMLVEFGMVCLAASVWTIGMIVHFAL